MVVQRIITAGKFPNCMFLPLAHYLKDYKKYSTSLNEAFSLILPQNKEACDFLISDWAHSLTSYKRFMKIPIFRTHPGLVETYQNIYYHLLAQHAKNGNHLVVMIESFLSLLTGDDQTLIKPNLTKVVDQIVSKMDKSELQGFRKSKYIDPNLPTDREIAYQLVFESVQRCLNP